MKTSPIIRLYLLVLCFLVTPAFQSFSQVSVDQAPPPFQVVGTKVYKDGNLYEAKHVGYAGLRNNEFPGPPWGICICNRGSTTNPFQCLGAGVGTYDRGRARIDYDLNLIRAMNANGIRTWDQVNRDLLDSAAARNLLVTAGINLLWQDSNGVTYGTSAASVAFENNEIAKAVAYVRIYKNHPAVFAWIMGNEVEINIPGTVVPAYMAFLERLAQAIKVEDPIHLVTTAIAYNPGLVQQYNAALPSLDFWSLNIYFDPANPHWVGPYANASNKPLYVSEYGEDVFDHTGDIFDQFSQGSENETWHASVNGQMAQVIRTEVTRNWASQPNARTFGGAIFQFNDQDWQTRGWGDACHHGIDQDGWHGPLDYQDIEYHGIFRNTPTTANPNALTARQLAARLTQIWQ
ncbi:MAG: hypothetical protein A2787_10290 [Omnitrophica WOR_2 bacterium RIFCSPHIGHO2_01_FULL_48_9]|nr:MAG: hypothetical protein A3D10_08190 [Omnitrophica WOR_2 bacterium RIFCSPHIGHO2_02_FULL_48_11]OGX29860.1 MAG: hypothetical protein A2787_10290 [Omnitrophica WOR_2 bacterium RIFCSPHIGHO2_01_FULL_48_9]